MFATAARSMTGMGAQSTARVVDAVTAPSGRYSDDGLDASHTASVEVLCEVLGVDAGRGLSAAAAAKRLASYGPNRPRAVGRPPYLRLVLRQFVDPLVALLVGAAVVSFLVGEGIEAAAIAVVIVLNAVLGFSQELGAERAIRALSAAFTRRAVVVRDGCEQDVPAEDVVPGDLLVVREREQAAADWAVCRWRMVWRPTSPGSQANRSRSASVRSRCRGKRRSLSGRPWFSPARA